MANGLLYFWRLSPAVLLAVIAWSPAGGTTFDVTKTTDTVDGNCNDDCSLRDAIIASNENPGHDIVMVPAGHYVLIIDGEEQNTAVTDDLDVHDDTTIVGAGVGRTIIDGNHTFRIFDVFNDTGNEANTTIKNMTITNAEFSNCGGGVSARAGTINLINTRLLDNHADRGGGLCSSGFVNVTDSSFEGNSADRWGGGMSIIPNRPTESHVVGTTFTNNLAGFEDGGGIEMCGCAGNAEGSTLTVENSTFVGNIGRDGGAVWNDLEVNFLNSTLVDNASTSASAAVSNDGGNVFFENTILDSSPGTDCDTTVGVASSGHNLESGTSCGLTGTGDRQNSDPVLGELADNGGPTLTIALLARSPAIDAGGNGNCPDTDQRGELRPVDGDDDDIAICDIGAYEAGTQSGNPGLDAFPIILDYLLDDDAEEG
jgi:CSLREA domain-containing protein